MFIKEKNSRKKTSGKLNPAVANQKNQFDIEGRLFTIGYEYYRDDLCQVKDLDTSPLRKSIENFKKFGKCTTILDLQSVGISLSNVYNSNHYQTYYKHIPDDAEVKEYDTGDHARSFFFIDPSKKVIQIIAHRNTHTEAKKQHK